MGGLIKKYKSIRKFNFINNKVEIGNSVFLAGKINYLLWRMEQSVARKNQKTFHFQ